MTKVISISDEAYSELAKLKAAKSFSKVILELTRIQRKERLMEFAGSWNDKDAESIKKEISDERRIYSRRFE